MTGELTNRNLPSSVVDVWQVVSILSLDTDDQLTLIENSIDVHLGDDVFSHYLLALAKFAWGFLEPLTELLENEESIAICEKFRRHLFRIVNDPAGLEFSTKKALLTHAFWTNVRKNASEVLESVGLHVNAPRRVIPIDELLSNDLDPYYQRD